MLYSTRGALWRLPCINSPTSGSTVDASSFSGKIASSGWSASRWNC